MGIHKALVPYGREDRVRLFSREWLIAVWSMVRVWISARVLMYPSHSVRYAVGALVVTVLICLLLSAKVLTVLTWLAAVYIVMELLDRFAQSRRKRFEAPRFHDFEKLDNSQRSLVYKREQLWEQQLLASYLETEFDKRKYLQFLVDKGQWGRPPYEYVRIMDIQRWGQTRIREMEDYGSSAEAILNDALVMSPHDSRHPANQVENLVAAADMIVELWEGVANWILRCRSIRVHDSIKDLPRGLSVLGMNMFNTLRDLPRDLNSTTNEAIEELGRYGGECTITVIFDADGDEFSKAIEDAITSDRIEEGIVSEL